MENNNTFLQDKLRVFVTPTDILNVKGTELNIYEKMVYIVLRSFCNGHDNAIAFPSYTTIAKLGSMSRAKAITVVESLLQKGLLKKEVRLDVSKKRKIRNTTNLYTLETPIVELPSSKAYGEGSLRNRPPLVHSVDYPQSTAWTTPSPQRRPEKTINKKQTRKNNIEKNNNIENPQNVVGNPKQEVHSDVVVDFLSKNGLEVNKKTIQKWRKLDSDENIIRAISEVLDKDEIKNVIGYVTRMLEAGYTPTVKKMVSKDNDIPKYVVERNESEQKQQTNQIDIEQQKEVLKLLFQLGEINQEDYNLRLKQLIEQK